jgi:hypothetical protein
MAQHLRSLGPRHHAAIRLKLDGASGCEIAETLGVETRTVYLWMGDPLVKQELARQLERISDEFARQLALAAMVGVSELREAVQLPIEGSITPEQKLAFIRETLDRFERHFGQPSRESGVWPPVPKRDDERPLLPWLAAGAGP